MKKTIGLILIFLLPVLIVYLLFFEPEYKPTKLELLKQSMQQKKKPSVDHSKFAELNKKFERPQDVTKTCISCHNKRDIEVMATSHWRWLIDEYMEGRGIISLGKRNAINNHCISIGGSEGSCNRCHIGYGYDSKNFDFTKAENIDCLSCHDNSGLYEKEKEAAGYPKSNLDFTKIAQSVGRPKMDNCGYCHFNGGGGNNSKHGDLEEALYTANREVDVHLARDGANFECVDCHKAENHNIKGRLYTVASMNRNRLLCEDCHSDAPHSESIINEHTTKVACQTCHIPTYAKVNQTKTFWDWSKAGKLK
ncbi:MAG TPA: cytochrome C, partial [Candidatus Kapabacteria bacterium]|nr:cytochrome C [Candidatus Kapabacteria bacterium]